LANGDLIAVLQGFVGFGGMADQKKRPPGWGGLFV